MKYAIVIVFVSSIFWSCAEPDATLRKELDTAVFKIDMLEKQLVSNATPQSGDLVHLVYLNTQDDLPATEKAKLIEELNQLQGIPAVKTFSLGDFKSLNDPRALSDYELLMSISFSNEADYQSYQDHPTHIALKEKLDKYLGGPPATYDYIQQ